MSEEVIEVTYKEAKHMITVGEARKKAAAAQTEGLAAAMDAVCKKISTEAELGNESTNFWYDGLTSESWSKLRLKLQEKGFDTSTYGLQFGNISISWKQTYGA